MQNQNQCVRKFAEQQQEGQIWNLGQNLDN